MGYFDLLFEYGRLFSLCLFLRYTIKKAERELAMTIFRAVYRNGQIEVLDTLTLSEGQEIRLEILPFLPSVHEVLADLLVSSSPSSALHDDFDEVALQRAIDNATQGITLSDAIIEERGNSG
jgi:predicted DNA-binding antitoxin AbrB/MazE fold protein